jgi:hypothetical protein
MLNTAVVAPIASASVATAMIVKLGVSRSPATLYGIDGKRRSTNSSDRGTGRPKIGRRARIFLAERADWQKKAPRTKSGLSKRRRRLFRRSSHHEPK